MSRIYEIKTIKFTDDELKEFVSPCEAPLFEIFKDCRVQKTMSYEDSMKEVLSYAFLYVENNILKCPHKDTPSKDMLSYAEMEYNALGSSKTIKDCMQNYAIFKQAVLKGLKMKHELEETK